MSSTYPTLWESLTLRFYWYISIVFNSFYKFSFIYSKDPIGALTLSCSSFLSYYFNCFAFSSLELSDTSDTEHTEDDSNILFFYFFFYFYFYNFDPLFSSCIVCNSSVLPPIYILITFCTFKDNLCFAFITCYYFLALNYKNLLDNILPKLLKVLFFNASR